jgi:iron complex outermembrane recepter protein
MPLLIMTISLSAGAVRLHSRAIAAGVFLLAPLAAQEIVLDRYLVTASRPAGGAPARVSQTELRPLLPIDVGALLGRELSSVTAVRRGGVASDVLLRGLGRDNVTVLLDGAPAYAACPGRMDPPVFHVSTPLIERIVVHAGPFDVREGAAPGGSIAITSAEPPATRFASASALAASDALFSADFAAGGPLAGSWRGLAGASYQRGRSYRDGDGARLTALPGLNYRPEFRDHRAFAIAHGELHAAWAPASGRMLTLRAAANDARDVFYPALQMDARRDRATRLGLAWSAAVATPYADTWRIEVHHHRVEHDMSDAFRTTSLGMWSGRGYMMRTVAATTGFGAAGEAEISRPGLALVYGGQLTQRAWIADNVIGANANPMLPDATMRQGGAFAQAERTLTPAWKLKAGVRFDAWRSHAARAIGFAQAAHGTASNARTDMAPSGFVLAERTWGDATAVFAGLGHGARAPDPQERYIIVDRPGTGVDWVGNPRLAVVGATEGTLGARGRLGPARVEARVFYSRLENFILLGKLTPAAGSTANAGRTESYFGVEAELTGAEIRASLPLGAHWAAEAGTAGQRGRKRSLIAGDSDRDLPEIPPWRGRATLRWSDRTTWIEAEAQWAARQTRLDATAGERPLAGYGVLHVRAERTITDRLTVSLGVENVFNRTYASHNAYTRDPFAAGLVLNEPGRSVYVRVRRSL